MARAYIPVYFDLLEEAQELTDQEFGRMVRAAIMYAKGVSNYMDCIQGNERFVFGFLKGQIDRNNAISDARAKAGANKKEQKETKEIKTEQKETKRFKPPTEEEVAEYCRERGNGVNPQKFIDFYASKGWKVGNQPMKDWKACVRTWEGKDGGKKVVAQGYNQRSYSDEQEEAMKRMLEGMRT